jgi:branched-chain amino acid aminotransferase
MRIHGMAPALNYGQQAYEGLKAFRLPGDTSIAIFRPDRNAVRLQYSADFISVPPVPTALFVDAVKAAVALNAEFVPPHDTGAAMYVRPQVYGSSAQLGLSPPEEYTFCVFVLPTGVYHGTHPVKALILDDFDRAAPNGTGSAKVGGNYAPVLRWSERARNEGYGITLHLDSKRHEEVDEFSTSGFIGALVEGEEVTLVVPDSKAVIDSVTSDSVQEIARSFGWKVEKRSVSGAPFFLLVWFWAASPGVDANTLPDQVRRAAQLPGGHGGGHCSRPRTHPVHHPSCELGFAGARARVGQGWRGDRHIHRRGQR